MAVGSDRAPARTTQRAYLPSLFTYPPPDEQTMAAHRRVYPMILQLESGDRVEARGTLDSGGLRLESLVVQ